MGRKPDPKVWGCLTTPCPFRHTTAAERASVAWLDAHTGNKLLKEVIAALPEPPKVRAKPAPKPEPAQPAPEPFTPEHPDGLVRFARSVWPSLLRGTRVVIRLGNRLFAATILSGPHPTINYRPDKLASRGERGFYQTTADKIDAIYWHPDETGEGLIGYAD